MPDEPKDGLGHADDLDAELRALATRLDLPPAPDPIRMAAAVRQRLDARRAGPVARLSDAARRAGLVGRPAGGAGRGLWLRYAAAALIVAFAVAVAGSAQVRAAIAEFFRFGGVVVEHGGGTPTTSAAPGGGVPGTVVDNVAAAQARVPFRVRVPAELGPPDEVSVIDSRVVSFGYRAQGIRLDQFDGTLDLAFAKQLPDQDTVEWTQVDGSSALWLRSPHELVYLDRHGRRHTEAARTAGPTLIWQHAEVTYRLEGAATLDRAILIAQSMR